MAIKVEFLGLDAPALASTADWLVRRYGAAGTLNLRDVLVVTPGARAGRRLLEILVDRADRDGLRLVPPEITTVGQLPERLYRARRPFADDWVQQLAWARVLRDFDRGRLARVVTEPPADDDSDRWWDLGRLLQSLHRELASDGLEFADVAERGRVLPGFAETERWEVLAEIRRAYLDLLDELQLWDRQTARLVAIEQGECDRSQPIVLVSAVDLNQSLRQMLDQVATGEGSEVTALVYAPAEWRSRFDEHGCLRPEAWQEVELGIDDCQLWDVGDAADLSDRVTRILAGYGGEFRADEVTIGMADERIVPQLVRRLDESGVPNRYGPGRLLEGSGLYRLMENVQAYVGSRSYRDLAELVRHPDVETWLLRSGVAPGWIEELDDYYNTHLPRQLDGDWLGDPEGTVRIREAVHRIAEWVGPLGGKPQPVADWLPTLQQLVSQVYGDRSFDLETESAREGWRALSLFRDALADMARIPESLQPQVRGPEVLGWALQRLQGERIAPTASDVAIELVGWLELPLDDAPALIVTSFNEGLVPSSVNADLFLPGDLRSALGLDDNARRYARDAWAVTTLLAPWRSTSLLVARRSPDDDPLPPSRLVFAAPAAIVAQRALRFFGEPAQREAERPLAGDLLRTHAQFGFRVPRPVRREQPMERMSVTSFKTFLACPYRFYLSRVLRLQAVGDDGTELDGGGFGDLAHTVLEQFGLGEVRDSADETVIREELDRLLNSVSRARFGRRPPAPLIVQVEQLRQRLHAFARWQAGWVEQGWRIEHIEQGFGGSGAGDRAGQLEVDGTPMQLAGRIDRIDRHLETGERFILDYKTSDGGDSPQQTHRNRAGDWLDLQLPLYRYLARELGIEGPVGLGYIVLPKKLENVGLLAADWSADELREADEVAVDVARRVRNQEFWPPAEPPPAYSEEFAGICLDGVFGRVREESDVARRDGARLGGGD